MAETRRKFDRDFKEGAVRIVRETGKPIAQVARELGHQRRHPGQLGGPGSAGPRARRRAVDRGRAGGAASGCAGRTRSWRWSVMCSSARSPSG